MIQELGILKMVKSFCMWLSPLPDSNPIAISIWYWYVTTIAILLAPRQYWLPCFFCFLFFPFWKNLNLLRGPNLLQFPTPQVTQKMLILCSSRKGLDVMLYSSHGLYDSHPLWVRVLQWGSLYAITSALLEKSAHQICERIPLVLYPNLSVLPPSLPRCLPSSMFSFSSLFL